MNRDAAATEQAPKKVCIEVTPFCVHSAEICPKVLDSVEAWPLFQHRDPRRDIYIVGSCEIDRYISVPGPKLPVVLKVLELLDGLHSLDSIQEYFYMQERKKVDVKKLYQQLYENGLLAAPIPVKIKQGDIEKASLRLFTVPVEKIFVALRSLPASLFERLVVVMLLLMAAGGEQAIVHRGQLFAPIISGWNASHPGPAVLLYPVLLLVSFLFHEIAHGIVASRYGLFAKRFEAALYLGFIPIIYLRIPGLYTLPPRERIKVWCAGIYWNLTFASFSILVLQWVARLPPARNAWLLIALANYFLALTNLFPFLPTDGYFILCTVLKTYNLRINAWIEFRNWISARNHRLSGILLAYLICTAAVVGMIFWKDVSWLFQLNRKTSVQWTLGLALMIVPWLILVWRWLWILWRSGHSPTAQLSGGNGP
jgi:putative peptide zinc metalloprotease protein